MSFRLIAVIAVLSSACASSPRPNPAESAGVNATGALAPKLAVDQFLRAVKAQDLQAMSVIFGTKNGAARDVMDRVELEKREIILACYFMHDKYRILSEQSWEGGHRAVRVELTKGQMVRQPTFYVIQGPGQRWYVDNMEIAAVKDFCGKSGN